MGTTNPLARVAEGMVQDGRAQVAGEVDLSDDLVVVPGARARRHLLFELAAAADARGLRLVPPRMVGLAEASRLLTTRGDLAVADDVTRLMAIHAALVRSGVAGGSLHQAQEILRLHRELSAAGCSFADAEREALALEADGERYARMGRVIESARTALAQEGFVDPDLEPGEPNAPIGLLHLVAVVDPTARQRALFESLRDRLVAWCVARPEHAGRFDALGTLDLAVWRRVEPSVDPAVVHQVDGPTQQARAAFASLADIARARGGMIPADAVTLVAADEALTQVIVRELRAEGVDVHDARGTPLADLPPSRLLARLRDHLREPSTRSLRRLAGLAALEPLQGTDVLSAFDRWRTTHHDRELSPGSPDEGEQRELAELWRACADLAGGLPPRAALPAFVEPIAALLCRVFGREQPGDGRGLLDRAIAATMAVLDGLHAVPPSLCGELDAADALDAVLALCRGVRVRDDARDDAIDLCGWLELPLDGAACAIVIGFNEGAVPGSTEDPLLPDSLRRALGLADAGKRLARDRYVLAALLDRERVTFTFGRRDARGEPLAPSALLLTGSGAELAQRVRAWTEDAAAQRPAAIRTSRFGPPKPSDAPVALEAIPVTGFRAYLRCPYRYWLRQIVRVDATQPAGVAMDDSAFGVVVHAILHAFGKEERRAPTADRERIAQRLLHHLDVALEERAGPRLGGGLRIQRQILRERLNWFAEAQAELVRQGWVMRAVERDFEWMLEIEGDRPVRVTGRIDRIDVRTTARGVEVRVIDYKTTRGASDPDKAHRKENRDGSIDWYDLQLPLYRCVLQSQPSLAEIDDGQVVTSVTVGYFGVGATPDEVGWFEAEGVLDHTEEALAKAREIVTAIRAARFEPNPDHHGDADDPLEILCRTALQAALGADDDDEVEP